MQDIEAIDLFCGIGGLTCGLRQAGIKVIAGLDNDESCSYAYMQNNSAKFIQADVSDYDFSKLNSLFSENSVRLLVGCAPCQPFSSHSFKAKNREKDSRWDLIQYFVEAVKAIQPAIVSMENVRGLTKTDVFSKFTKDLENMGYDLDYRVVYCPDYGIPQSRSRLVLIGSRIGKINIPTAIFTPDSYRTVEDVIKDLPSVAAGKTDKDDPMHKAKNLSALNMNRIRNSVPKGSWKDWPESLLPNCYKKESGATYTSVYGRMSWNDVSPTITTQFPNYGSGRFGHPEQDRALTLREGALLQTFPDDYDFGEPVSFTTLGRQIGNAVPPKLGEMIGKVVKEYVNDYTK